MTVTITFDGKHLADIPDGSTLDVSLSTGAPPPPAPPAVRPTQAFATAMTADQVRVLVNEYIAAGGVANIDNGQYWVLAWSEWGSGDPAYFRTKLEAGIAGQPSYNGIYTPLD
jgi:hypothetical protein